MFLQLVLRCNAYFFTTFCHTFHTSFPTISHGSCLPSLRPSPSAPLPLPYLQPGVVLNASRLARLPDASRQTHDEDQDNLSASGFERPQRLFVTIVTVRLCDCVIVRLCERRMNSFTALCDPFFSLLFLSILRITPFVSVFCSLYHLPRPQYLHVDCSEHGEPRQRRPVRVRSSGRDQRCPDAQAQEERVRTCARIGPQARVRGFLIRS